MSSKKVVTVLRQSADWSKTVYERDINVPWNQFYWFNTYGIVLEILQIQVVDIGRVDFQQVSDKIVLTLGVSFGAV